MISIKKLLILLFTLTLEIHFSAAQSLDSLITVCPPQIHVDSIQQTNYLFDADSLLKHAAKFIGKRYRYRGTSPKTGFDCSGYVMYNYKRHGIHLPHSSYEQIKYGEKVEFSEAKAGDLIFFKGRSTKSKMAGHVGIVVEVIGNSVKFIHSSSSLGVRYDFTHAKYYKARFLQIRRLTPESIILTKSK
jgi:cell wall-associated NlpC family hydrolase